MRLGGRVQAAIEILEAIDQHYRPVANALKDWGTSHRFAGSGDRATIGNIVYDALRMKLSHAYQMDDDSPHALAHAVLLRQWGISMDELNNAFDGDKFAPEPLSAPQRSAFSSRKLTDAAEHIQVDMPHWLLGDIKQVFGDDWLAEAQTLNTRPTLDLRVNILRSNRAQVLKSLSKFNAVAGSLLPDSIKISANNGPARLPNVAAEISFAKGHFEIQDEGSQLAAALVGANPGDQVLDYCAGGGGKALALASHMHNKGQIHTYDADPRRMAPMVERLRRAGTRNVQICEDHNALIALENACDHVLVDAPCTGAGTWRRRPDTKWRLSEKSLTQRIGQQKDVISRASAYVKTGGYLTYVTCSILPQENDAIITDFLAQNQNFELVDLGADFTNLTGQQDIPYSPSKPNSSQMFGLLCSPHRTQTDGFFVSKMVRRG